MLKAVYAYQSYHSIRLPIEPRMTLPTTRRSLAITAMGPPRHVGPITVTGDTTSGQPGQRSPNTRLGKSLDVGTRHVEPGVVTDVRIPDLVGLLVRDARAVGYEAGFVVVSHDIDGPPLGALAWPGTWVVTAQDPRAGAVITRGEYVRIEFRRFPGGGGAGDREPRVPPPRPRARQQAVDPAEEPTEDPR